MTGLEPPCFQEWARMEAAPLRRETHKSRLADARWVAALIAEMRDEDFLMKKSGGGGGGGKKSGGKDEKAES